MRNFFAGLGGLLCCSLVLTLSACGPRADSVSDQRKPNIIIFYADDLGYADLGVYGARGVETPEIDALAEAGARFTDAHSSAATCTPSRYSLLTGEYGFRNEAEILPGDAPLLIQPDKTTLASVLQGAGYTTGVVGKWHLGLGVGDVDWNKAVKPGPLEIGFDYSFLLPATGDRVPTVYLENYDVVGLEKDDPITVSYKGEKIGERPTGVERPDLLKQQADRQHSDTIVNGVSRIGHMAGGKNAEWVDEDMADVFTDKALRFIESNQDEPFFLFYSLHDIHVPRVPHQRFVGASTMGPRGDAIAQMDWMTGQVMTKLRELGLEENTIVIFTSDNGPILADGYEDQAVELVGDHNPAGPFRGAKFTAYEAGTRVPTIVYWPGSVEPVVSDALISQVDLLGSIAALLGLELKAEDAIDSLDMSDAWLGRSEQGREYLVKESIGTRSLRWNNYKYIRPLLPDAKIPDWMANKDIETGLERSPQIYDLADDIGEQRNLSAHRADLAQTMEAKLTEIEQRTRGQRD